MKEVYACSETICEQGFGERPLVGLVFVTTQSLCETVLTKEVTVPLDTAVLEFEKGWMGHRRRAGIVNKIKNRDYDLGRM